MTYQTPSVTDQMLDAAARDDVLAMLKHAQAGADLDAQTAKGNTALMLMAGHGDVIGLSGLLDLGANPDIRHPNTGQTAAHICLERDHDYGFETLMKKGANPNIPDGDGWTCVHLSAAQHQIHGLNLALAHGGDPAIQTGTEGWNAAHIAARKGYYKVLWPLLEHDADLVHARDHQGQTPAFHAVAQNDNISLPILHNAGADLSLQDAQGDSLAHLAARNGQKFSFHKMLILQYVLDHGAVPDAINSKGENAVFDAVRGDDPIAVEILARHGAQMERPNHNGDTPLSLAQNARDPYDAQYTLHKVRDMIALAHQPPAAPDQGQNQGVGLLAALLLHTIQPGRDSITEIFGEQTERPALWRSQRQSSKPAPGLAQRQI